MLGRQGCCRDPCMRAPATQLLALPEEEQAGVLREYMAAAAAEAAGVAELSPDRPLLELGLDSLRAAEFAVQVGEGLPCTYQEPVSPIIHQEAVTVHPSRTNQNSLLCSPASSPQSFHMPSFVLCIAEDAALQAHCSMLLRCCPLHEHQRQAARVVAEHRA